MAGWLPRARSLLPPRRGGADRPAVRPAARSLGGAVRSGGRDCRRRPQPGGDGGQPVGRDGAGGDEWRAGRVRPAGGDAFRLSRRSGRGGSRHRRGAGGRRPAFERLRLRARLSTGRVVLEAAELVAEGGGGARAEGQFDLRDGLLDLVAEMRAGEGVPSVCACSARPRRRSGPSPCRRRCAAAPWGREPPCRGDCRGRRGEQPAGAAVRMPPGGVRRGEFPPRPFCSRTAPAGPAGRAGGPP